MQTSFILAAKWMNSMFYVFYIDIFLFQLLFSYIGNILSQTALLSMRIFSHCPLAFGSGGVLRIQYI